MGNEIEVLDLKKRMIKKLINICFVCSVACMSFSCDPSINNDLKNNEVKTFSILFSTLSYVQLIEDFDKSKVSKMTVETHRFYLKDSLLIYQNGLGYNDGLIIRMEMVKSEKEIIIDETMRYKIGLFAESLLEYESYESNFYLTDCWVVNIYVNEKSFRLYSGENEHTGFYRDFHILRDIFYRIIIDAGYAPES